MRKILTLTASVILLSSCARGKPQAAVALHLNVPTSQKLSAMSVNLTRLMVNVSRPGMAPIYKVLDSGESQAAIANSVELDVPAGPGTLIQVMALYENESSGQMQFYYKDRLVDLVPGANEVNIQVENVGGASGVEGRIVGRYALAGPTYPTDIVEMLYDPGSGKRPFVLNESEIVGGWFNIFALDDVPFSYRLKTSGHIMSFTTNYSAGTRTESKSVRMQDFNPVAYASGSFPGIGIVDLSAETTMYRTHQPDGSLGDFEVVDPFRVAYGFHGSADLPWTGLSVTFYDTLTPTFVKMKSLAKDGADPDCAGITLGQTFEVSDVGAIPLIMTSIPCSVDVTAINYSPSGADTFSSALATWTNDSLAVDRSFIDGQGNDNLAPFMGGFRKALTSGSWDVIQRVSGGSCSIGCNQAFNFQILSAADTAYKAIRIYKSSSLSSETVRQQKDSLDCAAISAKPEFSLASTVTISPGTTSYSTGAITIGSGETTADRAVALCPVDAAGKFMPGAILTSTNRMFY